MNWDDVSNYLELKNNSVVWKKSKCKAKAGSLFGRDNGTGYLQGKIFNKLVYAHRIAWFLKYKEMPNGEIDHINGIRTDNRIENLRVVDRSANARNIHNARSDNKVGLIGVQKHRNKFRTRIFVNGVTIRKGGFDTPEEAHKAYINLKKQFHNEYVEVST